MHSSRPRAGPPESVMHTQRAYDRAEREPHMDFGEFLTDYGPWIGAIGTVVTLVALGFAFWAWARPKKGRLLCAVEDLPLGLPEDHELEVRFRGDLVERPRIVTVTLIAGRGTDLTPANFVGGYLTVVGHGIDVIGPIGTSKLGSQVSTGTVGDANYGSTIHLDPCIVQSGRPVEFSFLASWQVDWAPQAPPARNVTTRLRAGLGVLSAEIESTAQLRPTPFFEVDAKLGNFKVVTPDQVAQQRGRLTNIFVSAAAVGRL
jgi:hypothetical protein